MAWDGRDVLRDVLPRDPAQHVQRRCKLKAGEPGLRLRKSAFAEAAKSSVETFSAGRAGAHPYRRRRSGSILSFLRRITTIQLYQKQRPSCQSFFLNATTSPLYARQYTSSAAQLTLE